MFRRRSMLLIVIFLVAIALPACSQLSGQNNAGTTVMPTVTPVPTATLVPATATSAAIPTATPLPATEVPVNPISSPVNPTSSPVVSVVTATPLPTPQVDGVCTYDATFLADVTVPDNTALPAGTAFVKTWRVRNDGTCAWGAAGYGLHSLVFTGGARLSAPNPVPLPTTQVQPGECRRHLRANGRARRSRPLPE